MQLSKKQNEYIVNATHRWNIKSGAVRSGKSYVDTAFVVPFRIRERTGKLGLNVILGVSKESIERNVLQPMREIYTEELIGQINNRNMAMVCGEEVYCLGAEKVSQVAKIQGASIKYCYGDEIAKWNKEVFQMLKSRLDKPYSCFDGACNPEHPTHWLKGGKTYLPRLKKRLYKGMNLEDGKDKELYKEYSPAMRDEAFRRGLEEYKREIEFNVGLAYGDLSDAQEVDKTATEVLASKTRKYNRVTAIQEKLEECLNGFVNALAFYNGSYMSGVEFTCEFNDSILADEESERQQDRQDVSMGVMSLVEYRMKWYNEDEATAKSKIPEQNQVME